MIRKKERKVLVARLMSRGMKSIGLLTDNTE
jgi:hypothetical protein